MKKIWLIIGALVLVTVSVLVFITTRETESQDYKTYKSYAQRIDMGDWNISQESAESFASGNCAHFERGGMPAFKIRSDDHLKSTTAILASYCPDAFRPYLAGVLAKAPEYAPTVMLINDELKEVG